MPADFIQGLRQRVGPALLPLAYVTGVIRDPAGQILFQRRTDFGDAWWGLPGGLIEPGETLAGCLRREVFEETGLRVRPIRLTGLYSSLRYQVTYPNGHQVQQVTLCYLAEIESGSPRPTGAEIEALAFYDPADLPPRPAWYADMLSHALRPLGAPYFDPPEDQLPGTALATLAAVQAACGPETLPWPVAAAAVLDKDGRVLLRRSSAGDTWDLPATPLRVGETLARTAQRALRAQAGLNLAPTRLLGASAGQRAPARAGHQPYYPVTVLFGARLGHAAGTPSAAAQFFDRTELPPLLAPTADALRHVWLE
jgi:ADP-ribose pyrophosphatase YjhB (NUDIX family)